MKLRKEFATIEEALNSKQTKVIEGLEIKPTTLSVPIEPVEDKKEVKKESTNLDPHVTQALAQIEKANEVAEEANKASDRAIKAITESMYVRDRKELSKLIQEAKDKNEKFSIRKSLKEGFRYIFEKTKLKESYSSDKNENDLQMLASDLWSKYSRTSRNTIINLISNIKRDYDIKSFNDKKLRSIVDNSLATGTYDDYLDTGNTDYLEEPFLDDKDENKDTKSAKMEALEDVDVIDASEIGIPEEKSEEVLDKPIIDSGSVTPQIEENAFGTIITNEMSETWMDIDRCKSILATLTSQKPELQDTIEILNTIINERIMHIGMLQRILGEISPIQTSLIKQGEEVIKAPEEIKPLPQDTSTVEVGEEDKEEKEDKVE